MMPTLSTLAAPEVVGMTTSGTINDEKVGIVATFYLTGIGLVSQCLDN